VNERTGKRVALKVILPSFAGIGEATELFRREALAASKVNHPNVVSIFDVIDHAGMTCIVMELLDGETLDIYLARNGPLSLHEAVTLLLPAMRGVAAANAQGVVHRDLKPGNIFLCSGADGRLLTTKVLDFGISTMIERAGEASTGTVPLAGFGTPAYMAPEAIECSPNIDGRTDVYGFGVLLFEALTGQLPFPGEPGTALLARILTDAPPKVTEYRPDLPTEVVHIIDCALAKSASDRFPDVEHLIRAFEDQLLPPPPVRAVTPMTGIFQHPVSFSGGVVQAVKEREPSSRVRQSETKVLYSLAGAPQHASDTAGSPIKLVATIVAKQARRVLTLFPSLERIPYRRATIGTTLAVVLIVFTWLTIARTSRGRDRARLSSSAQYPAQTQGPMVTPLPNSPAPAAIPAPVAGNPPESLAESENAQPSPLMVLAPTGGSSVTPVPLQGAPRKAIRATAPLASSRVVRPQAAAVRPRKANLPGWPSGPRAGRLSAKDF
jgi:serine/threonine-protein kinase